jgi:hypothetical protein
MSAVPLEMTEGPKTSEPDPVIPIPPLLETAWRFGALVVGTLYVIGLLIVNIEMASFGVFNISLARAEYILVGTTWAALTGITVSAALVSLDFLPGKDDRSTGGTLNRWMAYLRKFYVIVLALFVAPSLAVGAIEIVSQWIFGLTRGSDTSNWTYVLEIAALAVNAGLLALGYQVLFSRADAGDSAKSLVKVGAYGQGLFTLMVWLILALAFYTAAVFPMIPQALGGGRRPLVYIVPAKSAGVDLQKLGLPTAQREGYVGPVTKLCETDTMYFVLGPPAARVPGSWPLPNRSGQAVGFEKQFVAAMLPVNK